MYRKTYGQKGKGSSGVQFIEIKFHAHFIVFIYTLSIKILEKSY